jgi:CubicO group peptidase (beta-lactamase class C family)
MFRAFHVIHTTTIVLLTAAASIAQDVSRMDQVVQSLVPGRFMGAVLVARGNEVLLSKGYGSANLEWQLPNTPSTKFQLASITKQFTAASILLLEEHGKLKIDDPIKQYLPDTPAAWDKITIFNLLTHTAGIANLSDLESFAPFPTTTEKLVARFRDKPLEFEPGARWNYSGTGYILLGQLIELLSGQTYERFLQENIFTPLGMKDSGYGSHSAVIARRAAGYDSSPDGPVNARFMDYSNVHSAGALYSTTEDMLRWTQGLFGGKLLSDASLRKMTTPFKNDYAFGLLVHTVNGRKRIDHDGISSFRTFVGYYPDSKVTVVVLANLSGAPVNELADKVASLAHGEAVQLPTERKEIILSRQVLEQYVGTYQLSPNRDLFVTLQGSQLITEATGQDAKIPLFAESEASFFAKVIDAQIEFGKDENGKVTHLTLHQGPVSIKAPRK